MGALTYYMANACLDFLCRGITPTWPTNHYVELRDTDPTRDNTNLQGNAIGARQPVTFTNPGSNQVSNTAPILFTALPASTATYLIVWDAQIGGNPLWYGPLAESAVIPANGAFTIATGALICTLDDIGSNGALTNYAENQLMHAIFDTNSFRANYRIAPDLASILVSLRTSRGSSPETSNAVNEPSGQTPLGYQRQPPAFGPAANGEITNIADITFQIEGSYSLNFVQVRGDAVASFGGTPTSQEFFYAAIDQAPVVTGAGTTQEVFPAGALTIRMA